jgi:site-specific DNA-methyltransferase (adenine-specific)
MNPIRDEWRSDDGSVRLILGDCLEVLPTLDGIDAVVTDPPYGIGGYVSTPSKWRRRAGQKSEAWDDVPADVEPLLRFDRVLIWGGNNYRLPPSRNFVCWYKPDAPPSMAQCEYAWCNWDGNARHVTCTISATNPERTGHPTQKPLRVMAVSLEHAGRGFVADPYMGSGTTGVACVRTGRRFVGIEIEPKYWEIAVRRVRAELERFPLFEAASRPRQLELLDAGAVSVSVDCPE